MVTIIDSVDFCSVFEAYATRLCTNESQWEERSHYELCIGCSTADSADTVSLFWETTTDRFVCVEFNRNVFFAGDVHSNSTLFHSRCQWSIHCLPCPWHGDSPGQQVCEHGLETAGGESSEHISVAFVNAPETFSMSIYFSSFSSDRSYNWSLSFIWAKDISHTMFFNASMLAIERRPIFEQTR